MQQSLTLTLTLFFCLQLVFKKNHRVCVVVAHIRCRSAHVLWMHTAARNLRLPVPHLSGVHKAFYLLVLIYTISNKLIYLLLAVCDASHAPPHPSTCYPWLFYEESPCWLCRWDHGSVFLLCCPHTSSLLIPDD